MPSKRSGAGKTPGGQIDSGEMDRIIARVRKAEDERLKGYREQSLRIHPWICARCGREFTGRNLHLLTVHHRDHNHDNNPPDGSNWENLCVYCHDNEHSRYLDHEAAGGVQVDDDAKTPATHKPFAGLADLLKGQKR